MLTTEQLDTLDHEQARRSGAEPWWYVQPGVETTVASDDTEFWHMLAHGPTLERRLESCRKAGLRRQAERIEQEIAERDARDLPRCERCVTETGEDFRP